LDDEFCNCRFCILQTLAFVYKFADGDFRIQVASGFFGVTAAIIAGTSTYCAAIFRIDQLQGKLLEQSDDTIREAVRETTKLKLAVVILSGLGALLLTGLAYFYGDPVACPP
jgi:hypothetical protein